MVSCMGMACFPSHTYGSWDGQMPGGGLTLKNQVLEFQTTNNAVCCESCVYVCVYVEKTGVGYGVCSSLHLKVHATKHCTNYANQHR